MRFPGTFLVGNSQFSVGFNQWLTVISTTGINNVQTLVDHSISPSSLSAGGDNVQFHILKSGGPEKNECLGGFKEFLPQMFAWGLNVFLVK